MVRLLDRQNLKRGNILRAPEKTLLGRATLVPPRWLCTPMGTVQKSRCKGYCINRQRESSTIIIATILVILGNEAAMKSNSP
jgi:hypothetical protein